MTLSIAIFQNTPPEIAGIVGAIFNSALQLGSAVGAALITSIQLGVDKASDTDSPYKGRAAGFWFTLGVVAVEALAVLVFYKSTPVEKKPDDTDTDAVTIVIVQNEDVIPTPTFVLCHKV